MMREHQGYGGWGVHPPVVEHYKFIVFMTLISLRLRSQKPPSLPHGVLLSLCLRAWVRGRSPQRCGWQPSPCTHLTAAVTLRRSLELFECWFWITRGQSHNLRGSRHSFSVTSMSPSFSFQMAPNILTSLSLQGPSTPASSTLCPPL